MEDTTKQMTEDGGQKTGDGDQASAVSSQVSEVKKVEKTLEEKEHEQKGEPPEKFEEKVEEMLGEKLSEQQVVEEKPAEKVEPSPVKSADVEEEEGKLRASVKGARNWYAVHTYSGYEDRVAENLKQRIESLDMSEKIFDVIVPKEIAYEIKNGKKRKVEKKIFPGYVLVDMIVTEDSWYVVRNTPNVTGFVGFGTTPTPVSEEEVKQIRKRMGVVEPKYKIDLVPGDLVKITDGPFKDFDGTVQEIDEEKGKVKVLVSMFGRETPVELDFLQIKKV
jgi:transcriptional antiterminator NusG